MIDLNIKPQILINIIKTKPFPEISKAWMDMSKEWIDHISKYESINEAITHSTDSSWILFTLRQLGYDKEADRLWNIGIEYMKRFHDIKIELRMQLNPQNYVIFTKFIKDNIYSMPLLNR